MFRHQFTTNPSINLKPLIHNANIELFEMIMKDLDHNKAKSLFLKSCKKGALSIAKELLKSNPNIDIHAEDEKAFRYACYEDNLEVAQWIWQLDQNINTDVQQLFTDLCYYKEHLRIAQWLLQVGKNINIHDEKEEPFRLACQNGSLETAQWLWQLCPCINIHAKKEYAFRLACTEGYIETARWLWQLNRNIDIHAKDEYAFRLACEEGHIETAQWLWQLDQNINIHVGNEYAFKLACKEGHLEIAKWLWQLDQDIDIHTENDSAFRSACNKGRIDVAQWLSTLCHNYHVEIDDNKIIKWLVTDENYIILELIENNKYNEAILKLNLKSLLVENKHNCMVCHDEPLEIIQLPCLHTVCLEAIVRFILVNHKTVKQCFYCQKEYQWNQCVSLKKIEL